MDVTSEPQADMSDLKVPKRRIYSVWKHFWSRLNVIGLDSWLFYLNLADKPIICDNIHQKGQHYVQWHVSFIIIIFCVYNLYVQIKSIAIIHRKLTSELVSGHMNVILIRDNKEWG